MFLMQDLLDFREHQGQKGEFSLWKLILPWIRVLWTAFCHLLDKILMLWDGRMGAAWVPLVYMCVSRWNETFDIFMKNITILTILPPIHTDPTCGRVYAGWRVYLALVNAYGHATTRPLHWSLGKATASYPPVCELPVCDIPSLAASRHAWLTR